jgi:CRISPR-associated protein Csb1
MTGNNLRIITRRDRDVMLDFHQLANYPRLLMEAKLIPVQGERFQPTGFPDLGAATYSLPDGTQMLLVESAQSMANRLEAVCWDDTNDRLESELEGMPYVGVKLLPAVTGKPTTNSLLEFHRLNSPYIMASEQGFSNVLAKEIGLTVRDKRGKDEIPGILNMQALAKACFKYDPNSVLHGVFLEKIDGRARLARLLSAFIEARDVRPAESGGVKLDTVNPSGPADQGYGNVPFHRTEYVAESITTFFSLDLAALRGYALCEEAERFLILLALWKVRSFLDTGLRLRTACDLQVNHFAATWPKDFHIPGTDELADALRAAVTECAEAAIFANPPVTELSWNTPKKNGKRSQSMGTSDDDKADDDAKVEE